MNRQEEALRLAEELLADIELDRIEANKALLKAVRLARLIEDTDALAWLHFELHGYTDTELGREYMTTMSRWIDKSQKNGYWSSLSHIVGAIDATGKQLSSMHSVSLSGDMLAVALNNHLRTMGAAADALAKLKPIVDAVIAEIHQYTVRTYHSLLFSDAQESLFSKARHEIDRLLAPLSGDHLDRVESINERLRAGDREAISQAMNTCRRLIDGIADALFAPSDESFPVGDTTISVKQGNVLNRLQAFVISSGVEGGRRDRLRRTMKDIYERTSTGVHADVTVDEARYLFLQTYVTLGEIVSLGGSNPATSTANVS